MWPPLHPDEYLVVWEGTVLRPDEIPDFLEFLKTECGAAHGARVLGSVDTLPGHGGPGGRTDLFFAVKETDIPVFALRRLRFEMRWWTDVAASGGELYPADLRLAYDA